MKPRFHESNRKLLYLELPDGGLAAFFAGSLSRRRADAGRR